MKLKVGFDVELLAETSALGNNEHSLDLPLVAISYGTFPKTLKSQCDIFALD